jgi:hypothetical protein
MIQKKSQIKFQKKIFKIKANQLHPGILGENFTKVRKFKNLIKENFVLKNKSSFIISIKVTSSNVFCVLKKRKENKTLILVSGGTLKLRVSKKKIKFLYREIINAFLKRVKVHIKDELSTIRLYLPKRFLKPVVTTVKYFFRKKKFILNIEEKKCFNGCRPRKARRKKRKGFRIFK